MKKRKLFSTALALSLGLGMLNVAAAPVGKAAGPTAKVSSQGSPIDLGIANDERLIEKLKRQGKIAKNASPAEAEKALQQYLKAKSKTLKTKDHCLPDLAHLRKKISQNQMDSKTEMVINLDKLRKIL